MQIIITGKNIELTDAIKAYVEKKIGGLDKFYSGIIRAQVEVGMDSKHHLKGKVFVAECKLEVPGNDLFASKMEKTLYKAIDKVKDYLGAELKKRKAKTMEQDKKDKRLARSSKEYQL